MVDNTNERTWVSWVGIIVFIAAAIPFGILFAGGQVPLGGRIALTAVFGVVTGLVALMVDVVKVPFFVRSTDKGAFDWYTLAHGLAGVAFGAWFLPLWWVVVVTVAWEMFEASVPGWGMHEPFAGRVVDVAVAIVGWFIVTGITALAIQGQLPLLITEGSYACRACIGS